MALRPGRIAEELFQRLSEDMPVGIHEEHLVRELKQEEVVKHIVGTYSVFNISGPSAAKDVLMCASSDKGEVYKSLRPVLGDGILTASSEEWIKRRRELAPSFNSKWMHRVASSIASTAHELKEVLLETHVRSGQPADMEKYLHNLSLEILGRGMFNFEFNSLNDGTATERAAFNRAAEVVSNRTYVHENNFLLFDIMLKLMQCAATRRFDPLELWKLPFAHILLPQERKLQQDLSILRNLLDKVAAQTTPGDGSFVDQLLTQGRTGEGLRDDIVNLFVAGHETTGAAMQWLLYCLMQVPEQLRSIRAEVDEVMSECGEMPSYDDVWKLWKTRLAVTEALRLYPSPAMVSRRLKEDLVMTDGRKLPAGSFTTINTYELHRRPQEWERPEEFDLRRWEECSSWHDPKDWMYSSLYPTIQATGCRYAPFTAGPRSCVGGQFAVMQAAITMAVLLRNFEFSFEAESPADVGIKSTVFSLTTRNGMSMYVTYRRHRKESGRFKQKGLSAK